MSLLGAWLLFPLIFVAVTLGCGLLVERATGAELPGALLVPLGLGVVAVAATFTTWSGTTAPATTPVVVAIALAGWVLHRRGRRLRPDPWALAAIGGVFLVFGAPTFLSGHATFAGYTILGDTSIHFIGIDNLLVHGRSTAGLPPSSYEFSLASYYGVGSYPTGSQLGVGALRPLTGMDIAWIFQPYLSLLAALVACAFWALATPYVRPRALRAAVVFIGAQPAIALGYALQGSVKELGTAWIVTMLGAAVAVFARQQREGWRRTVPLALAAGAGMAVLDAAILPWLGPFLLGAFVAVARGGAALRRRGGLRLVSTAVASFVVLSLALSVPALADIGSFIHEVGTTVTKQGELGNLFAPLDRREIFGIWLTGDYRVVPGGTSWTYTHIGMWVVVAAGVIGVAWALRRRAWDLLLLFVTAAIAWAYVTKTGSAWADAKVLMITAPVVLFAAMLGVAALWRRLPPLGALVGLAIAAGVLVSNALAYHNVSLAPRDRMVELQKIGQRFAGQGPTVYPDFEEFAKHFLRDMAPEGTGEGWQRRIMPLRSGAFNPMGTSVDLDQLTLKYLLYYGTIVVRRGAQNSRPPAIYHLAYRGRFYDVWQRPAGTQREVLQHVPLGDPFEAASTPRCADVRALAAQARAAHAELAAVPRPLSIVVRPAHLPIRGPWYAEAADLDLLDTHGPGSADGFFRVRHGGVYRMWLQGSITRTVHVAVDGRQVAAVSNEINSRGQDTPAGVVRLRAGRHRIRFYRGGGSLAPGNGNMWRTLGPLWFQPARDPERVVTVAPARWRSLCGRDLDWIEIVRGLS